MQSVFMEGFLVWETPPAVCREEELVLVHETFCLGVPPCKRGTSVARGGEWCWCAYPPHLAICDYRATPERLLSLSTVIVENTLLPCAGFCSFTVLYKVNFLIFCENEN